MITAIIILSILLVIALYYALSYLYFIWPFINAACKYYRVKYRRSAKVSEIINMESNFREKLKEFYKS